MDDDLEDKHPDGEGDRYASARGWDPNRRKSPEKRALARQKKLVYKKHHQQEAARTAIEVRPATEWLEDADLPEPRRDLFPPFWREGELAVLTGPPGVGKSLLAVQLAQELAADVRTASRCDPSALLNPQSAIRNPQSKVLLLDLERTDLQIAELYAGHKFSENLELGLLADDETPESYNGRCDKFYLDAIYQRLFYSEAPVVIIDNLSWLTRSGGAAELHSVMRSFRRCVNDTGRSMLLLRHSRDSLALHDQPSAFEMADSIFALCRSTMGENIRYVKALRQGFRIDNGELRMENSGPADRDRIDKSKLRMENPARCSRTQNGKLRIENSDSEHSPFSIFTVSDSATLRGLLPENSQLSDGSVIALRVTDCHRFDFAGVSPEELHLFDYAAHVKRVNHRLGEITQIHAPGLSLVPENRVNFLGITDGKPTKTGD